MAGGRKLPRTNDQLSDLPRANDLVFAYGTLKRGGEYEWVMQKAGGEFLGIGKLATPYPLVIDRYPCLLDFAGEGFHVRGEVYRLPEPAGWKHLDWLEDHPHEYRRRIEDIEMPAATVKAWTYFFLRPESLQSGANPVDEFMV